MNLVFVGVENANRVGLFFDVVNHNSVGGEKLVFVHLVLRTVGGSAFVGVAEKPSSALFARRNGLDAHLSVEVERDILVGIVEENYDFASLAVDASQYAGVVENGVVVETSCGSA